METYQHSDPMTGAVLDGRYRVDTLIATGGMSGVYRGLDLRLDRPVALKIMDSRYAGDEHFLTRFQREARATARASRTPAWWRSMTRAAEIPGVVLRSW